MHKKRNVTPSCYWTRKKCTTRWTDFKNSIPIPIFYSSWATGDEPWMKMPSACSNPCSSRSWRQDAEQQAGQEESMFDQYKEHPYSGWVHATHKAIMWLVWLWIRVIYVPRHYSFQTMMYGFRVLCKSNCGEFSSQWFNKSWLDTMWVHFWTFLSIFWNNALPRDGNHLWT